MHAKSILGALVVAALACACGGTGPIASCVPGASVACVCPSGASGAQLCEADGTYGTCSCAAADAGSDEDAGWDASRPLTDASPSDDGGTDAAEAPDASIEDAGTVSDAAPLADTGLDAAALVDAAAFPDVGIDAATLPDAAALPDTGTDAGATRPYVRALSLGMDFSCALLWSGVVRCWGNNGWGQLGDGSTAEAHAPTTVGVISDAEQISAGGGSAGYVCAVRSDHTVWCWGANGLGMLGYPDGAPMPMSTSPVAVPGVPATVVDVAAGWLTACARRSDGFMSCWGSNTNGELDDGTTMPRTGAVLSGSHNALGLAAGYDVGCAWFSGYTRCWGSNTDGNLGLGDGSSAPAVMGLTDAIDVSLNEGTVCAVRAGGTVACWGNNDHGQVGDGTVTLRTGPVAVLGLSGVTSVATGWTTNCALHGDGTVSCWGGNVFGEFGNGNNIPSHTAITVPAVASVGVLAMGERHVCAANAAGVWCWGANEHGQLGGGTASASPSLAPVQVLGL